MYKQTFVQKYYIHNLISYLFLKILLILFIRFYKNINFIKKTI